MEKKRRVLLGVLSAFFLRTSCTGLPHINLSFGTVVGLLQFQSGFFVLMIHADEYSIRKPGRISNLCFCALCREIKFYKIVISIAANLYACPLRSNVCSDWDKNQLEECCIRKRQTSVLAGIPCLKDAHSLMLNSWTSSVFIKNTPNNKDQTKLSSSFQTLPVTHSTQCCLNPF